MTIKVSHVPKRVLRENEGKLNEITNSKKPDTLHLKRKRKYDEESSTVSKKKMCLFQARKSSILRNSDNSLNTIELEIVRRDPHSPTKTTKTCITKIIPRAPIKKKEKNLLHHGDELLTLLWNEQSSLPFRRPKRHNDPNLPTLPKLTLSEIRDKYASNSYISSDQFLDDLIACFEYPKMICQEDSDTYEQAETMLSILLDWLRQYKQRPKWLPPRFHPTLRCNHLFLSPTPRTKQIAKTTFSHRDSTILPPEVLRTLGRRGGKPRHWWPPTWCKNAKIQEVGNIERRKKFENLNQEEKKKIESKKQRKQCNLRGTP